MAQIRELIDLTHLIRQEDGSDEYELKDDPELDELVREIFNIIPSYYEESEARQVRQLISEYVVRKLRQGK